MILRYASKLLLRQKRNILVILALMLILSINILADTASKDLSYAEEYIREEHRFADLLAYGEYFNNTVISMIQEECSNVKAISGVVVFMSNLYLNNSVYQIKIVGINEDPPVDTIPDFDWDSFNGFVAVVDEGLAKSTGLQINDSIRLLGADFRIIDIRYVVWTESLYYTGVGTIIVPINILRRLLGLGNNVYNRLDIQLYNVSLFFRTVYRIYKLLEKMNISVEFKPSFVGVEKVVSSMSGFFDALNYGVIIMSIIIMLIFTYVDVSSSYRELALMEVVGLTNKQAVLIYLVKLLLIITLSSILALVLGNFSAGLLTRYATKVTFGLAVPIPYFWNANIALVLMPALFGLISSAGFLFFFSRRELLGYVHSGYEYDHGKPIRVPVSNVLLRLAIRNLTRRKFRSVAIIALLAFSVGLSASFFVVVRSGETTYQRMIKEFKWDLFVITYSPVDIDELANYTYSLGADHVEKIFYASPPIKKISHNGREFAPPFGFMDIMGISGNETLINFDLQGKLEKGLKIIVSEKLANVLGLKIGDRVDITFVHPIIDRFTISVIVSGIMRIAWAGGLLILFHIDSLKEYFNYTRNSLLVRFNKGVNIVQKAGLLSDYLSKKKVSHNIITRIMVQRTLGEFEHNVETWLIPIATTIMFFAVIAIISIIISVSRRDIRLFANLNVLGLTRKEIMFSMLIEHTIMFTLALFLAVLITYSSAIWLISTINCSNVNLWIELAVKQGDILMVGCSLLSVLLLVEIIIATWFSRLKLHEYLRNE